MPVTIRVTGALKSFLSSLRRVLLNLVLLTITSVFLLYTLLVEHCAAAYLLFSPERIVARVGTLMALVLLAIYLGIWKHLKDSAQAMVASLQRTGDPADEDEQMEKSRHRRSARAVVDARVEHAVRLLLTSRNPSSAYRHLQRKYGVGWRQACRYGRAAHMLIRTALGMWLNAQAETANSKGGQHYPRETMVRVRDAVRRNDRAAMLQAFRDLRLQDRFAFMHGRSLDVANL